MPRVSTLELPGCPPLRAICSDALGFTKVLAVRTGTGTDGSNGMGMPEVVARWGQPGADQRIVAMSFTGERPQGLAVARKNGTVDVLDTVDGAVTSRISAPTNCPDISATHLSTEDGSNEICGVHLFRHADFCSRAVLTCTENGVVGLTPIQHESSIGNTFDSSIWRICNSGSVSCLKVDESGRYAAFGGIKVEMSLWELERHSRVWEAKKPRRDNLGLISPSHYTAATFLNKDRHEKFAVGTGHHQVRIYDAKAQRRAILSFEYGESPIKALAEDIDGFTLYVGTGAGNLGAFDIRTGKLLGGFKGKCAGSIRCITRHPSLPLIASCGLDRYLRIHDSKSRRLLAAVFLKQHLISVAFDDEDYSKPSDTELTESADDVVIVKNAKPSKLNGSKRKSSKRKLAERGHKRSKSSKENSA